MNETDQFRQSSSRSRRRSIRSRSASASPRAHPQLVLRRDQEAGDDQLPYVQARARRPVLRAHLRSDQGLRVPVRQVQADEVQGHRLREMRCRSHRLEGPPRADGPYRARRARRAHLVPEVACPRASACCSTCSSSSSSASCTSKAYVVIEPGLTPLEKYQLLTEDELLLSTQDEYGEDAFSAGIGAAGGQADADRASTWSRASARNCSRSSPSHQVRAQAQEDHQAPQGRRELHRLGQPPRVDDPRRCAGDPARAAPAGAARRRPLRDLGSQ